MQRVNMVNDEKIIAALDDTIAAIKKIKKREQQDEAVTETPKSCFAKAPQKCTNIKTCALGSWTGAPAA